MQALTSAYASARTALMLETYTRERELQRVESLLDVVRAVVAPRGLQVSLRTAGQWKDVVLTTPGGAFVTVGAVSTTEELTAERLCEFASKLFFARAVEKLAGEAQRERHRKRARAVAVLLFLACGALVSSLAL